MIFKLCADFADSADDAENNVNYMHITVVSASVGGFGEICAQKMDELRVRTDASASERNSTESDPVDFG